MLLEDHRPINFYNEAHMVFGLVSVLCKMRAITCVIKYPINQWRTMDHLNYLEFEKKTIFCSIAFTNRNFFHRSQYVSLLSSSPFLS